MKHRPLVWSLLLLLVTGCARDTGGLRGSAVATAHGLATDVAAEVLRDGGHAVDAAVAAAFALAVVEPYSSGLGGGGFFVVHLADAGTQLALDARETAPAAATRDMYLSDGVVVPRLSRDGALSVATPSLVKGLAELHARCGRRPWAELVEPARRLAAEGFPVDARLRERIEIHRHRFDAAARAVFLPGGETPAVDAILRQPDLAATLSAIRDRGAAGFHAGPVAERIVTAVQSAGGGLALSDLADYRPVWREPVRGAYRGHEVISMPPPSSGGVHLVQMLNMLRDAGLAQLPPDDPARYHRLAETMKFAYADRSLWLGDPDFTDVPVAWLTSSARADSQAALIRTDGVYPWRLCGGASTTATEGEHTTHLSVVDAAGNAVAATLTVNLGFGSGMVAAGTGVVLNDEMDDFVAAPGVPNAFGLVGGDANAVAPGKRPLSSMTPTILLRDGCVFMVTGSPGGSRIITATLQTVLAVVDHGLGPADAVGLPRIHQQWRPDTLFHEPTAVATGALDVLRRLGHTPVERETVGNVQLIVVDPDGRPVAASDPRGVGKAASF